MVLWPSKWLGASLLLLAVWGVLAQALDCTDSKPTPVANARPWNTQCIILGAAGSLCKQSCKDGYEPADGQLIQTRCIRATGRWSTPVGLCDKVAVDCTGKYPNELRNQKPWKGFLCAEKATSLRTCRRDCKAGYVGQVQAKCQANGTWAPTTGSCEKPPTLNCAGKLPDPVPNGNPWTTNCVKTGAAGKRCSTGCKAGFNGTASAYCNPSKGDWDAPTGGCTAVAFLGIDVKQKLVQGSDFLVTVRLVQLGSNVGGKKVSLTIVPPATTCNATGNGTTDSGGFVFFNCKAASTPGQVSIGATSSDPTTGNPLGTGAIIEVIEAATLTFTPQRPASFAPGTKFDITAKLEWRGAGVSGKQVKLTFKSNPGNTTCATTASTNDSGVATFACTAGQPGLVTVSGSSRDDFDNAVEGSSASFGVTTATLAIAISRANALPPAPEAGGGAPTFPLSAVFTVTATLTQPGVDVTNKQVTLQSLSEGEQTLCTKTAATSSGGVAQFTCIAGLAGAAALSASTTDSVAGVTIKSPDAPLFVTTSSIVFVPANPGPFNPNQTFNLVAKVSDSSNPGDVGGRRVYMNVSSDASALACIPPVTEGALTNTTGVATFSCSGKGGSFVATAWATDKLNVAKVYTPATTINTVTPATLTITPQPPGKSNFTTNTPFNVTITLAQPGSNVSGRSTVTFKYSFAADPASFACTPFNNGTTDSAGVATWSCKGSKAGSAVFSASSPDPITGFTINAANVTAALVLPPFQPATLAVTPPTSYPYISTNYNYTVQLVQANSTVTGQKVNFTIVVNGAGMACTPVAGGLTDVNGRAYFTCVANQFGSVIFSAASTDPVFGNVITAPSVNVTVVQPAILSFGVSNTASALPGPINGTAPFTYIFSTSSQVIFQIQATQGFSVVANKAVTLNFLTAGVTNPLTLVCNPVNAQAFTNANGFLQISCQVPNYPFGPLNGGNVRAQVTVKDLYGNDVQSQVINILMTSTSVAFLPVTPGPFQLGVQFTLTVQVGDNVPGIGYVNRKVDLAIASLSSQNLQCYIINTGVPSYTSYTDFPGRATFTCIAGGPPRNVTMQAQVADVSGNLVYTPTTNIQVGAQANLTLVPQTANALPVKVGTTGTDPVYSNGTNIQFKATLTQSGAALVGKAVTLSFSSTSPYTALTGCTSTNSGNTDSSGVVTFTCPAGSTDIQVLASASSTDSSSPPVAVSGTAQRVAVTATNIGFNPAPSGSVPTNTTASIKVLLTGLNVVGRNVTLELVSGGSLVSCATSATTSAGGEATFNCSIGAVAGTVIIQAYVLAGSDKVYTNATSFSIFFVGAATLTIATTTPIRFNTTVPVNVTLAQSGGNVTGKPVNLTGSGPGGNGSCSPASSNTNAAGVAQFTCTSGFTSGQFVLTANANDPTSGTPMSAAQSNITIIAGATLTLTSPGNTTAGGVMLFNVTLAQAGGSSVSGKAVTVAFTPPSAVNGTCTPTITSSPTDASGFIGFNCTATSNATTSVNVTANCTDPTYSGTVTSNTVTFDIV